jgi:hypothetical protein
MLVLWSRGGDRIVFLRCHLEEVFFFCDLLEEPFEERIAVLARGVRRFPTELVLRVDVKYLADALKVIRRYLFPYLLTNGPPVVRREIK